MKNSRPHIALLASLVSLVRSLTDLWCELFGKNFDEKLATPLATLARSLADRSGVRCRCASAQSSNATNNKHVLPMAHPQGNYEMKMKLNFLSTNWGAVHSNNESNLEQQIERYI